MLQPAEARARDFGFSKLILSTADVQTVKFREAAVAVAQQNVAAQSTRSRQGQSPRSVGRPNPISLDAASPRVPNDKLTTTCAESDLA
jgi:hypothetical protein